MIRAWIVEGEAARACDPAEAARQALAGTANVWIDFDGVGEDEVRQVLAPLGIHPLVIEDMVMDVNRPKVDNYGAYLYVVVHSARWEGERPALRELDIVVGEHFIATYHDGETRSIAAAAAVLPRRPELLGKCPAYLLYFILDVLVDHYLPIMDQVAEEIDDLEETAFDQTADVHHRVLHLKRGMSAMRRVVGPQRDTVLALTRDEFKAIPAEIRPYLRDVYDRLARVGDLLDSFREETAALLDLNVSMTSNRLNAVIKRLTVLATIGLPLTVVTSYYGMNFDLPEYKIGWPTLYALGLLAATGLATWGYIHWKRWD